MVSDPPNWALERDRVKWSLAALGEGGEKYYMLLTLFFSIPS